VDINPSGNVGSSAYGVNGDNIVGVVSPLAAGFGHAALWQGPSHAFVDLHPASFVFSYASGASQTSQVGIGFLGEPYHADTERHALLWHGSAGTVIDLHPSSGFSQTGAQAVAGELQAGFGLGVATGGKEHAMLWQGTASSALDLHSLLAGLGPEFTGSFANGINENGVIVGTAFDVNGVSYAIQWTPVPEPSAGLLLTVGALTFAGLRRRVRPRGK
jgi:uncharacterized membrane protein